MQEGTEITLDEYYWLFNLVVRNPHDLEVIATDLFDSDRLKDNVVDRVVILKSAISNAFFERPKTLEASCASYAGDMDESAQNNLKDTLFETLNNILAYDPIFVEKKKYPIYEYIGPVAWANRKSDIETGRHNYDQIKNQLNKELKEGALCELRFRDNYLDQPGRDVPVVLKLGPTRTSPK